MKIVQHPWYKCLLINLTKSFGLSCFHSDEVDFFNFSWISHWKSILILFPFYLLSISLWFSFCPLKFIQVQMSFMNKFLCHIRHPSKLFHFVKNQVKTTVVVNFNAIYQEYSLFKTTSFICDSWHSKIKSFFIESMICIFNMSQNDKYLLRRPIHQNTITWDG